MNQPETSEQTPTKCRLWPRFTLATMVTWLIDDSGLLLLRQLSDRTMDALGAVDRRRIGS